MEPSVRDKYHSVNEEKPLLEKSIQEDLVVTSTRLRSSLRWIGAALCLSLIIASWVTMAEKLQDISKHYYKPFFQCYLIHAFYAVMYIVWKFWIVFPGGCSCNQVGEGALSKNFKMLAIASGILAVLSFLSAVFWYISLSKTSISANTAIYQSSSIVVFIVSVPLLGEKVSLLKIISILFTVGGVSMVSVFTSHEGQHNTTNTSSYSSFSSSSSSDPEPVVRSTPLGYVFVVLSMILYALMETGYKKFCTKPNDPAAVQNSVRVLGYIGVHTALWMWPLLIILHFANIEPFELPDLRTFELLMVNALLDLIFNGGLFVCIALSSPLFTTVGSVLAIPASVLVDRFINHYVLPWQAFVGVAILLGGFLILVFCEYWEARYHHLHPHHHDNLMTTPGQKGNNKGLINTYIERRKNKGILYYIV